MCAEAQQQRLQRVPGGLVMVAVVQQQAEGADPDIASLTPGGELSANLRGKRLGGTSDAPVMPVHDVDMGIGEDGSAGFAQREAAKTGEAGKAELGQLCCEPAIDPVPGRHEDGQRSADDVASRWRARMISARTASGSRSAPNSDFLPLAGA
jgi:hypothetical protein